jgi:streptomycin 6-kinase
MRRYLAHGGGHHADSRQGDRLVDHRQGHGGARQGSASHVTDFYERGRQGGNQHLVRFSNDGNDD